MSSKQNSNSNSLSTTLTPFDKYKPISSTSSYKTNQLTQKRMLEGSTPELEIKMIKLNKDDTNESYDQEKDPNEFPKDYIIKILVASGLRKEYADDEIFNIKLNNKKNVSQFLIKIRYMQIKMEYIFHMLFIYKYNELKSCEGLESCKELNMPLYASFRSLFEIIKKNSKGDIILKAYTQDNPNMVELFGISINICICVAYDSVNILKRSENVPNIVGVISHDSYKIFTYIIRTRKITSLSNLYINCKELNSPKCFLSLLKEKIDMPSSVLDYVCTNLFLIANAKYFDKVILQHLVGWCKDNNNRNLYHFELILNELP